MTIRPRTTRPRADRKTSRRSRRRPAAQRLKEALAVLTGGAPGDDGHRNVTVAELCRIAEVSRNSLYRYHTDILQALQRYQQQHRAAKPAAHSRTEPLSRENDVLRKQLTQLATLVDHYYGAYRETNTLLQRRERELADLRRSLDSKPLALAR
jgi:AcrR family transcriptional regulator